MLHSRGADTPGCLIRLIDCELWKLAETGHADLARSLAAHLLALCGKSLLRSAETPRWMKDSKVSVAFRCFLSSSALLAKDTTSEMPESCFLRHELKLMLAASPEVEPFKSDASRWSGWLKGTAGAVQSDKLAGELEAEKLIFWTAADSYLGKHKVELAKPTSSALTLDDRAEFPSVPPDDSAEYGIWAAMCVRHACVQNLLLPP